MGLNKKTVDDINVKGKRVLVRCDFNVPLKDGVITDETRIVAALPTIKKLINDGGKVILCSHLGKVKNGPNEGESLAPVAVRLSEKLGKEVKFVADYNVTGEAATKAVAEMKDGDVVLLCHSILIQPRICCLIKPKQRVLTFPWPDRSCHFSAPLLGLLVNPVVDLLRCAVRTVMLHHRS